MASYCDPAGTGIWKDFQMTPDKTPKKSIPLGSLKIETEDADHNITGHRLDDSGVPQEKFTGMCRHDAARDITMINFKMFMDGFLYFFIGVITPSVAATFFLDGIYYVAQKAGPAPALATALAVDPGDTGGWGGSQGGR